MRRYKEVFRSALANSLAIIRPRFIGYIPEGVATSLNPKLVESLGHMPPGKSRTSRQTRTNHDLRCRLQLLGETTADVSATGTPAVSVMPPTLRAKRGTRYTTSRRVLAWFCWYIHYCSAHRHNGTEFTRVSRLPPSPRVSHGPPGVERAAAVCRRLWLYRDGRPRGDGHLRSSKQ